MAPYPAKTERRLWQRLPILIPVFVHGVDEDGRKVVDYTTVTNISASGAQLLIRPELLHHLRKSTFLLEIPRVISNKRKVPSAVRSSFRVRIVSTSDRDSGSHVAVGLKFLKPLIKNPFSSSSKLQPAERSSAS